MANPLATPAARPEPTAPLVGDDIVETDSLGRVPLGHPNRLYLMREESDGTMILEPAVVVREHERFGMAPAASQRNVTGQRSDHLITYEAPAAQTAAIQARLDDLDRPTAQADLFPGIAVGESRSEFIARNDTPRLVAALDYVIGMLADTDVAVRDEGVARPVVMEFANYLDVRLALILEGRADEVTVLDSANVTTTDNE